MGNLQAGLEGIRLPEGGIQGIRLPVPENQDTHPPEEGNHPRQGTPQPAEGSQDILPVAAAAVVEGNRHPEVGNRRVQRGIRGSSLLLSLKKKGMLSYYL